MPRSTPKAKPARQRKTPQQRAEEAYGAAQRRVLKANEKVIALEKDVTEAKAELGEARARLEYAAKDPALPEDYADDGQPELPTDD